MQKMIDFKFAEENTHFLKHMLFKNKLIKGIYQYLLISCTDTLSERFTIQTIWKRGVVCI